MNYRFLVVNPNTGLNESYRNKEFDNDVEAVQWAVVHYHPWWKRHDIYIVKQLSEDSCGPVRTIAKLIHKESAS